MGIHRLVFVLFRQLGRETVYAPGWRQNFNTREFAELYNLGLPVAAVYFNIQRESGSGGRRSFQLRKTQKQKTKKKKQLPRMETEVRNDGRLCFGQLLHAAVPVLFGNSVNGEVRDAVSCAVSMNKNVDEALVRQKGIMRDSQYHSTHL
ncbi:hypothetical protein JHK85_003560 [Glycine max]|nr:hypothetical protein JHK85_003560 [Glycine max]